MQDPNNLTLGRTLRSISGWTIVVSCILATALWFVVPFLAPLYGRSVNLARILGQDPVQVDILNASGAVFICVFSAASALGIAGIVLGLVAGKRGQQ